MGSPCSVSLANISIHPLETSFLKSAKNFLCFFRLIDDIFAISTSSIVELHDQIQTLNTLRPNLKFTAEISETSVNFSDITIYKGNDFNVTKKLSTKIYTKPCDTAQYIMPSSTHPPATFKGFIYGEFLCYARNTSEKDEFDKTCNRFKSNLLKRGYKEDFILDIQQSVSHSDRQRILETTGNKPKKHMKNIPLVFTTKYTGYLTPKDIKTALMKHWPLIAKNTTLNNLFKEPPTNSFQKDHLTFKTN